MAYNYGPCSCSGPQSDPQTREDVWPEMLIPSLGVASCPSEGLVLIAHNCVNPVSSSEVRLRFTSYMRLATLKWTPQGWPAVCSVPVTALSRLLITMKLFLFYGIFLTYKSNLSVISSWVINWPHWSLYEKANSLFTSSKTVIYSLDLSS